MSTMSIAAMQQSPVLTHVGTLEALAGIVATGKISSAAAMARHGISIHQAHNEDGRYKEEEGMVFAEAPSDRGRLFYKGSSFAVVMSTSDTLSSVGSVCVTGDGVALARNDAHGCELDLSKISHKILVEDGEASRIAKEYFSKSQAWSGKQFDDVFSIVPEGGLLNIGSEFSCVSPENRGQWLNDFSSQQGIDCKPLSLLSMLPTENRRLKTMDGEFAITGAPDAELSLPCKSASQRYEYMPTRTTARQMLVEASSRNEMANAVLAYIKESQAMEPWQATESVVMMAASIIKKENSSNEASQIAGNLKSLFANGQACEPEEAALACSEREWYKAVPNGSGGWQQEGPFNEGELAQHARRGMLQPESLVWSSGMDQWAPAKNIGSLEKSFLKASEGWRIATLLDDGSSRENNSRYLPREIEKILEKTFSNRAGGFKKGEKIWGPGMSQWVEAASIEPYAINSASCANNASLMDAVNKKIHGHAPEMSSDKKQEFSTPESKAKIIGDSPEKTMAVLESFSSWSLGNNISPKKGWLKCLPQRKVAVCDGDAAGQKLAKFADQAIFLPEGMDAGDLSIEVLYEILASSGRGCAKPGRGAKRRP